MKKTILFVEDDQWSIAHLVDELKIQGIEVIHALNAAEAKVMLNCNQIDLIVLDVMMPFDDGDISEIINTRGGFRTGIQLGNWIKSRYPNIPIVGFSVANDDDIESWFTKNSYSFVSKKETEKRIINHLLTALNSSLKENVKTSKSFIVHGHDDLLKLELKNYIQNNLKLPEPVILHERPSLGKTIIEKFEAESSDVDLVFVLLTPDDKISDPSNTDNEKRRARQNVIFEMGYFMGKINRSTGRVILLHKGPIELPSDISGLVYIDITDGLLSASEQIRTELSDFL